MQTCILLCSWFVKCILCKRISFSQTVSATWHVALMSSILHFSCFMYLPEMCANVTSCAKEKRFTDGRQSESTVLAKTRQNRWDKSGKHFWYLDWTDAVLCNRNIQCGYTIKLRLCSVWYTGWNEWPTDVASQTFIPSSKCHLQKSFYLNLNRYFICL